MAVVSACPHVQVLQQLALGRMPPADVERLARHCERCPRCIQLLHTLKADDALVRAVAAQGTGTQPPHEPAVDALIQRLLRMQPPAAAELKSTTTFAAAHTPSVDDPAGDVPEGHGLPTPPQGPGEIGRLGGYRVLRVLGSGGMGMVYQAEDTHLQRPVALKVMKPEVARNPTARERFLREARTAAKLKSDHVVTIHQVGEDHHVVFLAMEYLEGLSLAEWLQKGHRATPAQAARIGRQIALGLADAHACGLIHRDVKPGNVWLESRHQGRVKLLDFGLARAADDNLHLTQQGAIVGTPAYMAPEQARGEAVDHRADLFSLGVVLYRLCTGRLPFRGENTLAVLSALALETPPPPCALNPDVPPRLGALIERLLAKDREQRPRAARAVAEELAAIEREAAASRPAEKTTPPPALPAPRPRARPWKYLTAAGLLLLLGCVAAAIVVIVRDRNNKEVARIVVPEGGNVTIKDTKDKGKGPPVPKGKVRIEPVPLLPPLPGEPVSPLALVQHPAGIPGVRRWSILTRDVLPSGTAFALAYRPDGRRLAVGGHDGSVHVYEPHTGRLVQAMLAECMPLYALSWSPDGRALAGGSQSGESRPVRLWDPESGRVLRTLESPKPCTAHAVAWSPDGRNVLALDEWISLCLVWDAVSGKLLRQVPVPCTGPAFSPDGKRVAGLRDHAVLIWDTQTGKEVRHLGKHEGRVAWSPDGKRLACAGADALHVWDAATGKEILERKDLAGALSARWSPDGKALALGRPDHRFLLLELAPESATEQELEDFAYFGVWSPDGKTIAGMPGHGGIDLFDSATGKRARSVCKGRYGPHGCALSPDGRTVAVIDGYHKAFLASADTGRFLAELKETTWPLVWSPDGKRLAAGGPDHAVVLWDAGGHGRRALAGHQGDIAALAWSPDGKRLASAAAGEKRVLIWDAEKGERSREAGPFPAEMETSPRGGIKVGSLRWSPDGRLLAFNVPELGWHVWDVAGNRLANDPKRWKVPHFDFAPHGRNALVYSPPDGAFLLRDVATGEERGRLPYGQISPVWSRDGRLLAMPGDSQIELWSGDLRRRLRTLTVPSRGVAQVTFTADGRLVTGLGWGGVHVWETATGRLRGILQLPGKGRYGLTVSAEGHYTGNTQARPDVVVLVQKNDGSSEVLEPDDFERKYGFKNDPDKVHLLRPPPPPWPPEPISPLALVQEPARLPGVRSWTIVTRDASGSNPPDPMAYRPDGKRLAAGSWDGSVRVYDPETGRLVQVLFAECGPLSSLAWSPDGAVLAGGCQADEVRQPAVHLWDAEKGRLLRRLEPPFPCIVYAVAWSPNGRNVLAWGNAGCLVWEAATGKLLRKVGTPCTMPFFSPDGKRAAGVHDQTLFIWDTETGQVVRDLGKYQGGLAWSPDGKRLACAGADALRVWELETGKKLVHRRDLADGGFPQWSPDGGTLALARGSNYLFHLLDLAAPAAKGRALEAVAWFAVWSPDGKTLALQTHGAVDLFDFATGKRVRSLCRTRWAVQAFAWSGDRKTIAVQDVHSRAFLASADTGRLLMELKGTTGPLAWSPDGKRLAAAGSDQAVVLWESGGRRRRTLTGHRAAVTALAWSPDGKRLASGAAGEKRLLVWDAEKGQRFREVGPFATAVQAAWAQPAIGVWRRVTWSPDGKLLAFNRPGVGWHVWDVEQNRLANDPRQWKVDSFDFAPGGRAALVYLQKSDSCELRDLATGEPRSQQSLRSRIFPVWSPGGQLLAVAWGSDIDLWRADLSGRVRTLTGTYPYVSQVAVSADGEQVASLAGERLHVWETDTGRPRGILLPAQGRNGLAITADGHYACNNEVKRNLVMVVQKEDGTQEVLTPAEFEHKYGFKNDPARVRLTAR